MDKDSIESRAAAFQRNDDLESLLSRLNKLLEPAQESILKELESDADAPPLIFLMGPLRSGTTLFMQGLASTGAFAYPTNLLSRFYAAPGIGALIQLLLTDDRYNFRNEILDFSQPLNFESRNGKTTGALAPNEFWYFWRRFIPDSELDWMSDDELLKRVDTRNMGRELKCLAKTFEKPFALKGMMLNYNVAFLNQVFDQAFFVQLTRDPVDNVASILDARQRQFGDESTWYSFKIPEYPQLAQLDSVHQCAGQVTFVNRAITRGMSTVPDARKVNVDYEDFCRNPRSVYEELLQKLGMSADEYTFTGPSSFQTTRSVDGELRRNIGRALAAFDA